MASTKVSVLMPSASSEVRRPPTLLRTAKGMTKSMPYRATNHAPPRRFWKSMPDYAQKHVLTRKNMFIYHD
jgi:hypothetical protein